MLTTIATRLTLAALFPLSLNMECSEDEPAPRAVSKIERVVAGADHTCVIAERGSRVRCWGLNDVGQLGQGNSENFGDDEPADMAEDVLLAKFGAVAEVAAGAHHTCARSQLGYVRCWGHGDMLGVEAGAPVGDDEPVPIQNVDFGFNADDPQTPKSAIDIAANVLRTCAVLNDNTVRCWGYNIHGELGLGFTGETIGDDEPILAVPPVPVGAPVRTIEASGDHVCGITTANNVRCWGVNNAGQLGYGHTNVVGDDDTPADAGDVDLGGDAVVQLALGGAHTCARTLTGKVRCWGLNAYGQLGRGDTKGIGDDETPAAVGYVPVDNTRSVVEIAAGSVHTCAVLDDGAVKCWGYGFEGQLGYGNKQNIGDDEAPASAPAVSVGGKVLRLTMGEHTCALMESHHVRCWGINYDGQLGYGHTSTIGDDEAPNSAGDVLVF